MSRDQATVTCIPITAAQISAETINASMIKVNLRQRRRIEREIMIRSRPRWFPDFTWDFTTWSVRRRPFDYTVDEADIPLDPEDHWHRGDRQQFDLYLRPAGAVVQR